MLVIEPVREGSEKKVSTMNGKETGGEWDENVEMAFFWNGKVESLRV